MASQLYHTYPKRLFCFGCSFTQYLWSTWANILGTEFHDAEFYNFGKSGAGNHYIFNAIMQADSVYTFNHEDLVIVQWTNVSREDRYLEPGRDGHESKHGLEYGAWITPGNIYTQDVYNEEWRDKYFSEYGAIIRDLAFIKGAYELLKHRTQWHFIQMNNLTEYANQWDPGKKIEERPRVFGNTRLEDFKKIYSGVINSLKPSFYDVLFNNNWMQKFKSDKKLINKNFQDGHPHPLEHYDYLKRIFKHEWRDETDKAVERVQQKWVKHMDYISRTNKKFSIYEQPVKWLNMARHDLLTRKNANNDHRMHL